MSPDIGHHALINSYAPLDRDTPTPGADDMPATPTLAAALSQAQGEGLLAFRTSGTGDDLRYTLIAASSGVERVYGTQAAWAWLEGWQAGRDTPKRRETPPKQMPLRAVLVNPSLQDGCRIAIHAALEEAGITMAELAELAHRNRRAVSTALSFTGVLSMQMAEDLMTALNRKWTVYPTPASASHDGEIPPPAAVGPEPQGLHAGRGLAIAAEAGLIRVTSPMDPDKVRRARYHDVVRGSREYQLRVEMVLPWLAGLADAVQPGLATHL